MAAEWSLGSLAREWSLGSSLARECAREWSLGWLGSGVWVVLLWLGSGLARVKVKLSDTILGRILWLGSGVEVESGVGSVLWQLSDVCRIDGVKYI